MKKNNYLLYSAMMFLLGACAKSNQYIPNSSPVINYEVKGKKGADFSTNTKTGTWWGNTINTQAHWFYTWGLSVPKELAPQNCEFTPMFWSGASVTDDNIAYVKQLNAQGRSKFVLGFNEPDLADQSNMTVSQALSYWPKLESIGLPLGSPATSWPTRQWFYDFMDSCKVQGKRVDFICVHMYVGTDENAFVQVLQDLYNKYKLPIWITEFATVASSANTMSDNPYTPAMVLGFMQRLLPKLEALTFVQRYSWFSGSPTSARLWPSALVDAYGNLTTLGQWYSNYQPNTQIKR
ncbi:MAG: glycosyl hydrolase [Chitinophagaceae bacterium]